MLKHGQALESVRQQMDQMAPEDKVGRLNEKETIEERLNRLESNPEERQVRQVQEQLVQGHRL